MNAIQTMPLRTKKYLLGAIAALLVVSISYAAVRWYSNKSSLVSAYKETDRTDIMQLLEDNWYWMVSEDASHFSVTYMLDHKAADFRYPDNSLSIAVIRNEEHRAVAFVTFHRMEAPKGRVQFLAVAKEYRNKGYARALLEYALTSLKKQGVTYIEIAVRKANIPARSLYEQFGFKQVYATADGFLCFAYTVQPEYGR